MEIEIETKKNNPLLQRTEVHFFINHEGKGTPDRELIRSELADKLNVKKDNVVINHIDSDFGIQKSTGYAKIYKSVEKSKNFERKHILKRNKLIETKDKKKEEKAEEKPAEKPKEEPAEKPKEPVAEPPKDEKTEEKPPEQEKPDEIPKQEEPSGKEPEAQDNAEEKPKSEDEKKE